MATQNIFSTTAYNTIPDPGTGVAIPVTQSANLTFAIGAGAETNTIAAPSFVNQILSIAAGVDGGGSRVITVASTVNQTGNNTLTFADTGDAIILIAIRTGTNLRWRVLLNDGVALSTV
jgi:hypothetical protein